MQLLEIIKGEHPTLPVVMISGHGNIETAVTATKLGAYDFIEKPFKADRLVLVADRAIEASRLKREVSELRARAGATNRIVGKSTAMNQLRQLIERIAPANSRIMITGTPGSGKELVARTIHEASNRAGGPFYVINAATIAPETMEVELFGTEPLNGHARRVGALEEAHGGTLYIDEIADMPKETQAKILRVLVDQNFTRVGGIDPRACRCAGDFLERARSADRDRRRRLSRGFVPPAFRRPCPRADSRRAARRYP